MSPRHVNRIESGQPPPTEDVRDRAQTQSAESSNVDESAAQIAIALELVADRLSPGQASILESALRFAFGGAKSEDLERVRLVLRACLIAEIEEPLERALGMLATTAQRRLAQRDHWYRRAIAIVSRRSSLSPTRALDNEWSRFVSRGAWTRWRELKRPPENAPELDIALFWLTRHNGGDVLNPRHGYRILFGSQRDYAETSTLGEAQIRAVNAP